MICYADIYRGEEYALNTKQMMKFKKWQEESQLSENTHYWTLLCYFSWVLIETKNTQISIDLKKNLLVYSRSVYENLFLFFIKIDVL